MLTDHLKVVCIRMYTHPVGRKDIGYKNSQELLEISKVECTLMDNFNAAGKLHTES